MYYMRKACEMATMAKIRYHIVGFQKYKKNRFARIILKYIQLIIHSERLRNVSYFNRLTI
jgi:hypothetical protein